MLWNIREWIGIRVEFGGVGRLGWSGGMNGWDRVG